MTVVRQEKPKLTRTHLKKRICCDGVSTSYSEFFSGIPERAVTAQWIRSHRRLPPLRHNTPLTPETRALQKMQETHNRQLKFKVAVIIAVAVAEMSSSRSLGELGGGIDECRADESTHTPVSFLPKSLVINRKRSVLPVRVVDLGLLAQELPLASLVGEEPTCLVTVFLGLEEWEDVQSRPDLFTGKFTNQRRALN